MNATPSTTSAVFFIVTRFPKQNLNRNRQTLASTFPGIAQRGFAASASKPFPVVAQTLSLKSTAPANSKMQAPRADPESRRPPRPMG
jgi:hypothetical protein